MGNRCASCKYFDVKNKAGDIVDESNSALPQDQGVCRVSPPSVIPPNDQFDAWYGRWPGVLSSDWCGHYSRLAE